MGGMPRPSRPGDTAKYEVAESKGPNKLSEHVSALFEADSLLNRYEFICYNINEQKVKKAIEIEFLGFQGY
jgi:hypothetical protein